MSQGASVHQGRLSKSRRREGQLLDTVSHALARRRLCAPPHRDRGDAERIPTLRAGWQDPLAVVLVFAALGGGVTLVAQSRRVVRGRVAHSRPGIGC